MMENSLSSGTLKNSGSRRAAYTAVLLNGFEKSGVMAWGRTIRGIVIPRKPFRKLPRYNELRYPHHKAALGESHQQSLHNRAH